MKNIKRVIFVLIFATLFSVSFAFGFVGFDKNEVVVVKDTAIYSEPRINSKEISSLSITETVLVESNVVVTNVKGIKEEWLFIDTRAYNLKGERVKGWIKRNTIARPKDFKPVKEFGDYYIEFWSGDARFACRFYKNGTYKEAMFEDIPDIGSGDRIERFRRGRLYQYKNIIATDIGDIHLIDKEGNLFAQYYFGDPDTGEPFKAITNKKKFPVWAQEEAPPAPEDFYTVTGDKVNVRAEASTNAAVLITLPKRITVVLLKRSDVEVTIRDKKGYWAYVDTGYVDKQGNIIKGWVFDYYLKKMEE